MNGTQQQAKAILAELSNAGDDVRKQYNILNRFLIKCYAFNIQPILLLNEYFTPVKQAVKHPPLQVLKSEDSKKYVCTKCSYETDSFQAFIGHQKRHSPKYANS